MFQLNEPRGTGTILLTGVVHRPVLQRHVPAFFERSLEAVVACLPRGARPQAAVGWRGMRQARWLTCLDSLSSVLAGCGAVHIYRTCTLDVDASFSTFLTFARYASKACVYQEKGYKRSAFISQGSDCGSQPSFTMPAHHSGSKLQMPSLARISRGWAVCYLMSASSAEWKTSILEMGFWAVTL